MKKIDWITLIFSALLAVFIVMLLTSCEKCENCTTRTTTIVRNNTGMPVGQPQVTEATFETCGTTKDIESIEGVVTATAQQGNYTATTTQDTNCK